MILFFFDLELACSSDDGGRICEFGYVTCDGDFNISESGNFIMNPNLRRSQWDPYVIRNILSRSVSEYESAPDFPHWHARIRDLIASSDMVFGHTIAGDVGALCSECRRYGLPQIDFIFYDTKKIFTAVTGERDGASVTGILNHFGIAFEGKAHDARCDAINTMLGLKAIAQKAGKTPLDLAKGMPGAKDFCENGEVGSILMARRERAEKARLILSSEFKGRFRLRSFEGRMLKQFALNAIPVKCDSRPMKRRTLRGRIIFISPSLIEKDFARSVNLIQAIRDRGGSVAFESKDADMAVVGKSVGAEDANRLGDAMRRSVGFGKTDKPGKSGNGPSDRMEAIPFEVFLAQFGISEEDLNKNPAVPLRCLLSQDAFIQDRQVREAIAGAAIGDA